MLSCARVLCSLVLGATALGATADPQPPTSSAPPGSIDPWAVPLVFDDTKLPTRAALRLRGMFSAENYGSTLALSQDGRLLAVSRGRGVDVLDLNARAQRLHLERPGARIEALAFSPAGDRLAVGFVPLTSLSGGEASVRFFDVASGRETQRLEGAWVYAHSLAFSVDGGRLVTSGSCLCVWNPTDGQQLKALPSAEPVRYAVVSDDGRVVVALILPPLQHRVEKSGVIASFYPPRSLLYWEVDTGVHRLLPDSGFAEHLALARDGSQILVTARQSPGLVVRELGGGPPILALNEAASLVAMSLERSMLAVAGLDGRIRLLQWPSRRSVDTLGGHLDSALTALAFSRNGSRLVSAARTEILIWDFQGQRGSAVAPR